MFGIGTTEILVILVVALIVLGPKSLPKLARTLGKGMAEFRRVSTDFQRTINTEIDLEDHEKRKKAAAKRLYGDDDTDEEATPKPKKVKKAKPKPATAKAPAKPASGDLAVAPDETAEDEPSAAAATVPASAVSGDNA